MIIAAILLGFLLICSSTTEAGSGDPIISMNDNVNTKDLKCAACLAVIDVINKHMLKRSFEGIETQVYDALDEICEQKNYRTYDFSPPNMVKGCTAFMDEVGEEEFAEVLVKHYSKARGRSSLEVEACSQITLACVENKRLGAAEKQAAAEKKAASKTPAEEDQEWDETVEALLKEHGGTLKQPKAVRNTDEL